MPLTGVVMPFVLETDGHAILPKTPKCFLEAVIKLLVPFSAEERFDLLAPFQELRVVSPDAVFGVGKHNTFRVARIPEVLCCLNFCVRTLFCRRRNDRLCH